MLDEMVQLERRNRAILPIVIGEFSFLGIL